MSNDPEKADPLVRLLGAFGAALKQIEDDVQTMVAPFQKLCRQLVDLSAAFQRAGESLPNAILAAMFAKIEDETPPGPLRNLTMTAARLVLSEHEHEMSCSHHGLQQHLFVLFDIHSTFGATPKTSAFV